MTEHEAFDRLGARGLSAERHRIVRRVGPDVVEAHMWRVMGRDVEGDWMPTLAEALAAWGRSAAAGAPRAS